MTPTIRTGGEGGWLPIETAPRDGTCVLLYGAMRVNNMLRSRGESLRFSGYWDLIDEAWCATGSAFNGPFFDPTHWMPLPLAPGAA